MLNAKLELFIIESSYSVVIYITGHQWGRILTIKTGYEWSSAKNEIYEMKKIHKIFSVSDLSYTKYAILVPDFSLIGSEREPID